MTGVKHKHPPGFAKRPLLLLQGLPGGLHPGEVPGVRHGALGPPEAEEGKRKGSSFSHCSVPLPFLPVLSAVIRTHGDVSWPGKVARDRPVLQHRLHGLGQIQVVGWGVSANLDHHGEILSAFGPPAALGTFLPKKLSRVYCWTMGEPFSGFTSRKTHFARVMLYC